MKGRVCDSDEIRLLTIPMIFSALRGSLDGSCTRTRWVCTFEKNRPMLRHPERPE